MEDSRILRGIIASLIAASAFVATDAHGGKQKESYCTGTACQVYGPDVTGIGGGWGGGQSDPNSEGDYIQANCGPWWDDARSIGCDLRSPPPLTVNGCGAEGGADVPDFLIGAVQLGPVFREACNTHDQCYGTLGADKAQCDANLQNDMIAAARESIPEPHFSFYRLNVEAQAWAYSNALRWESIEPFTSNPAFDEGQRQASCRHLSDGARQSWCLGG